MSADAETNAELLERVFQQARAQYGDIGVPAHVFIAHLRGLAASQVPCGATDCELMSFCSRLHAADLYLSIGCALHNPAAWSRFTTDYFDYIQSIASTLVDTTDEALEFADALVVDLFLPDRTGQSRIASYSGRSSLATWLRVLVCHRAINDRKKARPLQPIESLREQRDESVVERLEATLRSHRYSAAVQDSLREACCRLSEPERLVLLLRYERSLKVGQIAEILQVHPSNVTRRLERACERLRLRILHVLDLKHQLKRGEIDECVRDLCENPSYSILSLLNETPTDSEPPQRNVER